VGDLARAVAALRVNTPLRIQVTDDARTQIAAAAAWWTMNRPAAVEAGLVNTTTLGQAPIVTKTIILDVAHATKTGGRIDGFRFLWGFYVNGYRSDKHGQQCFYGKLVPGFSTTTDSVGRQIRLDEMGRYPYVDICGVSAGPNHLPGERNLHLPLEYSEGETVETTTYNGFSLRAHNARRVPIPPLTDHWNGLGRGHARCKNFQFAVAMFGYPSPQWRPRPRPSAD
jgi:hypothetical protein